jgi:hypothetical protein
LWILPNRILDDPPDLHGKMGFKPGIAIAQIDAGQVADALQPVGERVVMDGQILGCSLEDAIGREKGLERRDEIRPVPPIVLVERRQQLLRLVHRVARAR